MEAARGIEVCVHVPAVAHHNNHSQLPRNLGNLNIRVGLHAGLVFGGLIGRNRYRYHLYGPAVVVANAMEAGGEANRVLASQSFVERLSQRDWHVKERSQAVNCGVFGDVPAAFLTAGGGHVSPDEKRRTLSSMASARGVFDK